MAWFEHGTSRIYYEVDGSGDPVLLLPGFSDRIENHSVSRKTLTAAGYRVIAADLPGSGRSLPQPRSYAAGYHQTDARAFLALLQHEATAPAHVLGFSDGGECALFMAEMSPGAVRSLVIWGASGMRSDPTGQNREAMYNVIDQPIPPLQGYHDYLIATYGEDNARAMTRNFVQGLNAVIDEHGGDLGFSKAGTIACPALLISGEYDMLAPVALVSRLAARISHAQFTEAKDAAHEVHTARPEWLAQTILDWLTTERSQNAAYTASTQA